MNDGPRTLSKSELLHLSWLSRQTEPMWGAHLERNEPITDGAMQRWIECGWIREANNGHRGYVLTETGRALLAGQTGGSKQTHCYTCGSPLGSVRYECPTCRELQCSDECRRKHIETMDAV